MKMCMFVELFVDFLCFLTNWTMCLSGILCFFVVIVVLW